MQKRRSATPLLPVTADDANRAELFSGTKRRGNSASLGKDVWGVGRLIMGILLLGLMVVVVQRNYMKRTGYNKLNLSTTRQMQDALVLAEPELTMPLDQFTSLRYALDHSQLVALYFAASWCPMSSPVTNQIDSLLGDILLPPPQPDQEDTPGDRLGKLSLVYISSDSNAQEMMDYMRPSWIAVPFESPDRNNLKRHFMTCAKRELEPLQMSERKREIPTLLLLSGENHQVLTFTGIQDLKEYGAKAVDHWLELERLTTALDSKYDKKS
jgi:hypothetical protein